MIFRKSLKKHVIYQFAHIENLLYGNKNTEFEVRNSIFI